MCDEAGRRDEGFTLLEVLVALAIALLAFAVVYRASGEALHTDRVASRTLTAVAHAQSRLTAICRGGAISAGTDEGDDGDGFSWASTVTAVKSQVPVPMNSDETIPADQAPPQRITLFEVVVQATDLDGRSVSLATRCLGQRAEPQNAEPQNATPQNATP